MDNRFFGGRYRLTEKIGSGGMADVYKAVDETLGRTVAVKVMHEKYANDPQFTARFRQEAQAAANLQSPYIVNIYDWGQEGNTYYIVMEYVRGTDLKSMIQSKPSLPSKQVADIGAQVCAALAVAHGYDIIHRDIKPHNIMVTPDGNVKVMDFGIARAGNSSMTQTGSVLGTAHYVSPEQAQGRSLTNASDLYSLGVVLYEAACGRVPFDADSPVAVALKQVNEQPMRPTRINPNIDPGLERVIGRALAKDPRARYATAEDMRQDLLRVVRGQEIPFGDSNAATTVIPVVGGAADGMTTVMPRIDSPTKNYTPNRGPEMQSIPEEKNRWWIWVVIGVIALLAAVGIAWGLGLLGDSGVVIPNVVGQTLEQAQTNLTDDGFKIGKQAEVFDPTIPAGSVVDQSPTAGVQAPKGSSIDLIISKGPQLAEVPKLIGLTEDAARKAITDAGFVPDPLPAVYDEKVEAGVVVSQSPEEGEQLAQGSKITYTASRGVETAQVPNVIGQKSTDAKTALTDLGFKVTTIEEYSSTVAKGLVTAQNPGAGLVVGKGTKVTITVSKGAEIVNVTVPDVVGLTVNAATTTLKSLGFKVTYIYEPHSQNNTVLEQDPSDGASLPKGSTISLIVDMAQP